MSDQTVRLVHEVTDREGRVLTRISLESFGFSWPEVVDFQKRTVVPVVEAIMAMSEEFAAASERG